MSCQTRHSWKDPVEPDAHTVSSFIPSPVFLCRKTVLHPSSPTVLLRGGQGRRKDRLTTDHWCFSNSVNKDFDFSSVSMGWHDRERIWHIRWCDQVSAVSHEKSRSQHWVATMGCAFWWCGWAIGPCYTAPFSCCEVPQLCLAKAVRKTKKGGGSAWQRW